MRWPPAGQGLAGHPQATLGGALTPPRAARRSARYAPTTSTSLRSCSTAGRSGAPRGRRATRSQASAGDQPAARHTPRQPRLGGAAGGGRRPPPTAHAPAACAPPERSPLYHVVLLLSPAQVLPPLPEVPEPGGVCGGEVRRQGVWGCRTRRAATAVAPARCAWRAPGMRFNARRFEFRAAWHVQRRAPGRLRFVGGGGSVSCASAAGLAGRAAARSWTSTMRGGGSTAARWTVQRPRRRPRRRSGGGSTSSSSRPARRSCSRPAARTRRATPAGSCGRSRRAPSRPRGCGVLRWPRRAAR